MNISKDEIYYSDIESSVDKNDQEEIYFSDEENEKIILSNESQTYCDYETRGTGVKINTTDVKAENYSNKTAYNDKNDKFNCAICYKKIPQRKILVKHIKEVHYQVNFNCYNCK